MSAGSLPDHTESEKEIAQVCCICGLLCIFWQFLIKKWVKQKPHSNCTTLILQ